MLNQMYEQYCANRLPCGICRLTDLQCPKVCGITIDCSKVTCTTNKTGTTVDAKNIYNGTTEATTTTSATYGVKGSTWASVNTKEEPK